MLIVFLRKIPLTAISEEINAVNNAIARTYTKEIGERVIKLVYKLTSLKIIVLSK